MTLSTSAPTVSTGNRWNIGLWAAQILMAAMFGMAAYMKLLMAPEALVQMGLLWVENAPVLLVRFIGFAELLGAIGLILPAATRIMPDLTRLAAVGVLVIQILAFGLHAVRGEFAALPVNVILMAVAVFIIWGRTRKSPIAARS